VSKTILAIDDDPAVLEFYKVALAGLATVRLAHNMREARAQLDGVNLILLDFDLAHDEETFQELVPELRQVAPVLLCSAILDERIPTLGKLLGIAGYWNKGDGLEALHALVQSELH
jgi:DNA-binding NtrC family response regulator